MRRFVAGGGKQKGDVPDKCFDDDFRRDIEHAAPSLGFCPIRVEAPTPHCKPRFPLMPSVLIKPCCRDVSFCDAIFLSRNVHLSRTIGLRPPRSTSRATGSG